MVSCNLSYLLKALPSNTTTLGLAPQYRNLGGHTPALKDGGAEVLGEGTRGRGGGSLHPRNSG